MDSMDNVLELQTLPADDEVEDTHEADAHRASTISLLLCDGLPI